MGEPFDGFLTQVLRPWVECVLQRELADQYFFIRYWERGPHIRLRFAGEPERLLRDLKPELAEWASRHFATFPSEREALPGIAGESMLMNDTLHLVPYEPEIDRYGGPEGVRIAERQFRLSSDAVLSAIALVLSGKAKRMSLALHLTVVFIHALGLTAHDAAGFFRVVCASGLELGLRHSFSNDHERRQRVALMQDAFGRTYATQANIVAPAVASLWRGLQSGAALDARWMRDWATGMTSIQHSLMVGHDRGSVLGRSWVETRTQATAKQAALWYIYTSYHHMNCNRLGIRVAEEPYLAYLVYRTLEDVTRSEVVDN